MTEYIIETTRTEYIRYVIEADSADDAAERFLMDGDEIASETASHAVDQVTPTR